MSASEEFETFVAARQQALLRLTLALTGDRSAAEDLAQSALAKLWPRWNRVSTRGDPWAYLQRIVLTTRASWWRRPQNRIRTTSLEMADHRSGADAFTTSDDRALVVRWVGSLPPRQRAVIVARYLLDMSVDQVAGVLDCSPGTVKSQTSKALSALRGIAESTVDIDVAGGVDHE